MREQEELVIRREELHICGRDLNAPRVSRGTWSGGRRVLGAWDRGGPYLGRPEVQQVFQGLSQGAQLLLQAAVRVPNPLSLLGSRERETRGQRGRPLHGSRSQFSQMRRKKATLVPGVLRECLVYNSQRPLGSNYREPQRL